MKNAENINKNFFNYKQDMQFAQYTIHYNKQVCFNERVCEKCCLMALYSAFPKMSCIRKSKCIGNMAFN